MAPQPDIEVLERKLKEETEKYHRLKQVVDKDNGEKVSREKTMLVRSRESDFIEEKIKSMNIDKIEHDLARIKQLAAEVQEKRLSKQDKLDKLRRTIEEFDGIEPTNEALKKRIEELKKTRLSLDYVL